VVEAARLAHVIAEVEKCLDRHVLGVTCPAGHATQAGLGHAHHLPEIALPKDLARLLIPRRQAGNPAPHRSPPVPTPTSFGHVFTSARASLPFGRLVSGSPGSRPDSSGPVRISPAARRACRRRTAV